MDEVYKTGVEAFDKVFTFLTGDLCWEDHGGVWYRKVSASRFHVVRIFNWEVETGEGEGWHIDLLEVDTDDLENAKKALSSWGYAMERDGTIFCEHGGDILADKDQEETRRLILCESMQGYGCYAPLGDWDGDPFEPLFKCAAELSNELCGDEEAYERAMNRPVNKIGSTAREYQKGDLDSAMMRGISRGDQSAEIMAIMHYGRENLESIKELASLMYLQEEE